ncbi:TPA: fimbria/pilus periplasmic chaperone [Photobacterium damselae]
MNKFIFILLSVLASNAHAIAISSLFESANKNGDATFEIVNNDGKDMYISFKMAKVNINNGKKEVDKLNKDNLSLWEFTTTPSRTRLKPNERKKIKLKYTCKIDCDSNRDKLFYVDVAPAPYSESKKSSLAFAFGYRVFFLVPAKKMIGTYKIARKKHGFFFENSSNTMLTAVLNTCTKDFNSDCIYQYRVLPNNTKEFILPNDVKDKANINFTVINANEEFSENYLLH